MQHQPIYPFITQQIKIKNPTELVNITCNNFKTLLEEVDSFKWPHGIFPIAIIKHKNIVTPRFGTHFLKSVVYFCNKRFKPKPTFLHTEHAYTFL